MSTTKTFRLRPVADPQDYEGMARLFNFDRNEPIDATKVAEWEKGWPEEGRRVRCVAVDQEGQLIGYADAERWPWAKPGKLFVYAVVDPAWRRQGVGGALVESLQAFIQGEEPKELQLSVRDSNPEALAYVERRGFKQERHLFESTLDLTTWDESRFAGVVEAVEASGIRFVTLAEEPGEATERKLYELMCRTVRDIPGHDSPEDQPFEQRRKWIANHPADCIIIAADGDRFVGLTAIQPNKVTGSMYTNHSSVAAEYRGRQIALALKLLSIRVAQKYGAPFMRTNNDSQNQPMLAVNRKLGYKPEPGIFILKKDV